MAPPPGGGYTFRMGQVSLEDVEVIQRIARDASRGGSFCERMADVSSALSLLIPAATISSFAVDQLGRPLHAFYWNGEVQSLMSYATHYRQFDPMRTGLAAADGKTLLLSQFVSGRTFGKDAYTSDFLAPLGVRFVMGVAQRLEDRNMVAVAIQRDRALGDFTPHEHALMALVAPDLTRAAQTAILSERVLGTSTAPANGLLLDEWGEVVQADEAATKLLAADPNVQPRLRDGARRLRGGTGPWEGRTVVHAHATLGGYVNLTFNARVGAGPRRILVAIDPLAPGSPDYFAAAAAHAGLSDRERGVAALALQGLGNRGIAHRLAMSESTVKFHLTNIFKKTRAPGRPELFHVLLGVAPTGLV